MSYCTPIKHDGRAVLFTVAEVLVTIILAVFLYDLAYTYIKLHRKGCTHGKVMTLYPCFKMAAIELEIYPPPPASVQ